MLVVAGDLRRSLRSNELRRSGYRLADEARVGRMSPDDLARFRFSEGDRGSW